MIDTGVTRPLDNLGRIVLPIELRNTLDIKTNDSLEVFVDGNQIIFKKYEPGCVICGSMKDIRTYMNKAVCRSCRYGM
jgi:transcriptional pleiotropic regulator of transition state genes